MSIWPAIGLHGGHRQPLHGYCIEALDKGSYLDLGGGGKIKVRSLASMDHKKARRPTERTVTSQMESS